MIRVVNLKNYKPNPGEVLIKVDRSTILGNPYKITDRSSRGEVISQFKTYLLDLYKRKDNITDLYERELINTVENIIRLAKHKDIALGCWCHPKACHADIYKELIELELRFNITH